MEKEQRSRLQKATQDARRLLEEEFSSQLLETYDINVAAGRWNEEPGAHLQAEQRLIREKLMAWIEHRSVQINDEKEALLLALREMAFTALNRFVALKLMEARELVRPCVSGGLESDGFQEFTAVAQGLLVDQESSYRLYLETIFEDVSRELRALFDPRDPASLLWPKRTALLELLEILNRPELAELWIEDETLGWVYQYFNGDAERKKMREESSAPRNSRELAVRNQFFTPRYVVEFLTDNTLGRIWYEMRQGESGLKERCRYLVRRPNEIWLQPGEKAPAEVVADDTLTQEELLRQPVHIPFRPLKDPREIRMLDPACGSMHFGLYAFDLYIAIYEEALEIAQGSDEQYKQGEAFAAFVTYAADFASKAAFLREVPRLILLHNIHGIDIDPRASQIARLTLWLRAQRAWQEQGVEVAARPAISRSNVVCAEPMPGERELLADFVDQQFPEAERGLVQQLLETIFDKMQLAGEAGSLLKIEGEILDAIDQAKREWQKLAIQQRDLFSAAELSALGGVGSSLNTDLENLTKDFWLDIEERIYTALSSYAEQAQSGGGFQRRLFAEDAAQGFSFIDACRKRYDTVVMNPPFGSPAESFEGKENYPYSGRDIYAMFVERMAEMRAAGGRIGAILPGTGLFIGTMTDLRAQCYLALTPLEYLVDLGKDVLDGATIRTACYVIGGEKRNITCARIGNIKERESRLAEVLDSIEAGKPNEDLFVRKHSFFQALPGSAIAYWIPERLALRLPSLDKLEASADIRQGIATGDNFRFLRLLNELSSERSEYCFYSKGGEPVSFISDETLYVRAACDCAEMKANAAQEYGSASRTIKNEDTFRLPGITYSQVNNACLKFRVHPANAIYDMKGPVLFPRNNVDAKALLAFLNSSAVEDFMRMMTDGRQWHVSALKNLPAPKFDESALIRLADLCERAARLRLAHYHSDETGHFFSIGRNFEFPLLEHEAVNEIANEIDAAVWETYGATPEEVASFSRQRVLFLERAFTTEAEPARTLADAFHYAVGSVFGRWDIRYATGERPAPELADPFAPLPVCPPGQLQNAQGLPARPEDVSSSYPVRIPWDGILVDDPNHTRDLEHCVREVIEIIWSGQEGGPTADSIEHEACDILGVKSLRDYYRKPADFFADHLKRYSKSRRQAPIYWQLSVGNGSYFVWLYYHRFTQDTLYRVLRGYVEPRIQQAEREQFELETQGALSGDAATRLLEAQTLLQDLRLFKNELDLVAPLWNPNLNDGVIINHAILWRITPYIPWQKKCKECWNKLVKGDYDWAHLAFHLWPERVIKKCQSDRSLAIAHGFEERLWQETSKGNWLQRQLPEAELQALLAEYSKNALQNYLERFLAAPPPVAAARTRAPRAAKSSTGATRQPRGSAPAVDAEASRQTLLVLTAAKAEGLGRHAIADLLDVEASSLTAVIKQLKESDQIEQLGAARGARYRLTEQGRAALASQSGEED